MSRAKPPAEELDTPYRTSGDSYHLKEFLKRFK